MRTHIDFKKLQPLALNPWVILGSITIGMLLGILAPEFSLHLSFVGAIYVDLMKMVVLPFMVSAIIFSLHRLFQEGGTQRILGRISMMFAAFAFVTAMVAAITLSIMQPGSGLSPQTLETFGRIVNHDVASNDTPMSLHGTDPEANSFNFVDVLVNLVPANIFAALANGDTLKALVFSLLFGFAVGQVPHRVSDGLTRSLETIYQSCQTLTRWFNVPLPLILLCMSASQLAKTGLEPLEAMAQFVLSFYMASALALALALGVIKQRSGLAWPETIQALWQPFTLALATRNSVTCMPTMIESLVNRLGFSRSRVELLVPLSVSLLRIGPVLYYVCATLFIAQLYGRSMGPTEVLLVLTASILAGLASAGTTGLVTISLTSLVCNDLGLPFEAAFVLFAAVDPLCDLVRTLVIVIGNTAAVTLICPRPLKI
jgi:Na+/H+-dicarboxylate symporter